jgi:glucose/arabinose dehydrogenase
MVSARLLCPVSFSLAVLCSAWGSAAAQVPISSELVVSGLQRPVGLTAPRDGTGRLMVLEKITARIRVIEDGVLLPEPFLDLGGTVAFLSEQGLLGLAFHPNFAANGRFFVVYNDLAGALVLEEYFAAPGAPSADPSSALRLMTLPKSFPQHNAGTIAFSGDGTLFFTVGDGNNGGNVAQDLTSPFGKVLRLDVDSGAPLAIPVDNPYVGLPSVNQAIYAYGFRNPWRASVDRETGDLWLGDVGGNLNEEVNWLPQGAGGLNFGWRCFEGAAPQEACPGHQSFEFPVHAYDHSEGCAVIGGHVYRGLGIAGLWGTYFFGDHCTGRVWSFRYDGAQLTEFVERTTELGGFSGSISSFGEDAAGELYIVNYFEGEVRRVVPAPVVADCDDDGVPDADELALGTAFDVNGNLVPDACEQLLTVSDLVIGQEVDFDYFGAAPGQLVLFLYTLRGIGEGPCFYDGAWCLDLQPTLLGGLPTIFLLAPVFADAQGHGHFDLLLPPISWTLPIAFQAVAFDFAASATSNPVQKQVQ